VMKQGSRPSTALERTKSDSAAIIGNSPLRNFYPGGLGLFNSILSRDTGITDDEGAKIVDIRPMSPTRDNSKKKVDFNLNQDALKSNSDESLGDRPAEVQYMPSTYSPFSNENLFDKKMATPLSEHSVASASTLGFDDEDDASKQSYSLLGGMRRGGLGGDNDLQSPGSDDSGSLNLARSSEIHRRKEIAIEQSYWPFHRHYEINGQRRVVPIDPKYIKPSGSDNLASIIEADTNCSSCLGDPKDYDADLAAARSQWQLNDFEKPISDRKDGGLAMDVTGIDLPLTVVSGKKAQQCDGKIFYMGIIDVLQQFNVRKRLEAKYRRIKGGSWEAASCIHPDLYADRFIRFLDEYTARPQRTETSMHGDLNDHEQIDFETALD
jgi:hypothetical protein